MSKILLMYSNFSPSLEHQQRLQNLSSQLEVAVADSEKTAIENGPEAEIIIGHRYLRQTLPHTRQLKWVQSTAAGVQHLLSPDILKISPILTRCPIFSDVVALHAVTLALAILRRIPDAVLAQQRGEWAAPFEMLPLPQTAMILGMGSIGQEIAKNLRSLGLTVLGVVRSKSPEIEAACDELLDSTDWQQHLPRADLCFIALPLTKDTRNLFDEAALAALPSHAVLVNVGRGGIVDTEALVRQLQAGQLGGAALDVIEPIPQSPDEPIWKTPRLLITPKVAVYYPGRQKKLEAFVESQVQRYLNGQALLYPVALDKLAQSQ